MFVWMAPGAQSYTVKNGVLPNVFVLILVLKNEFLRLGMNHIHLISLTIKNVLIKFLEIKVTNFFYLLKVIRPLFFPLIS